MVAHAGGALVTVTFVGLSVYEIRGYIALEIGNIMETKVKIVLKVGAQLPSYMTPGSAGADLFAHLEKPLTVSPMGGVVAVPTGVSIELPIGFEAQIRPRSGLAKKHAVTVLNAPGTIDSDYRGEIIVLLINHGRESYTIAPQERIAQMVIAPVTRAVWEEVETLEETIRNSQGFGHTGK